MQENSGPQSLGLPSSGQISAVPDPLAPIAPAPGAARHFSLRLGASESANLDPDGVLRLGGQATKKLLTEMLCLPSRLAGSLPVELTLPPSLGAAGGQPIVLAPKFTSLRVQCPIFNVLSGSASLEGLQSSLEIGKQRWAALTFEGELSSVDIEFLYWRRTGGGPQHTDPVYCLRVSRGQVPSPPVPPAEHQSEGSDQSPDVDASASVLNDNKCIKGPEDAAADFLRSLAPPPAPRTGGDEGRGYGRHPPSRERSRNPRYRRERSRSYSPPRHRSCSPSGARSNLPSTYTHPGAALPAQSCMDSSQSGVWAMGTPCARPEILQRLQPPAPDTQTLFVQKIVDYNNLDDRLFLRFAPAIHGKLLGLPYGQPLPTHPVRMVMVVRGAAGSGGDTLVPTCIEGPWLLGWDRVVGLLGDVCTGTLLVFQLIGSYRLRDSDYKDFDVLFFVVHNRGYVPHGGRVPLLEGTTRGAPLGPPVSSGGQPPHGPRRHSHPPRHLKERRR